MRINVRHSKSWNVYRKQLVCFNRQQLQLRSAHVLYITARFAVQNNFTIIVCRTVILENTNRPVDFWSYNRTTTWESLTYITDDDETYGDPVYQRCTVNVLVRLFDVAQIDFGSAHDDSDQLTVVGAHARHGSFQLIGVVVALLLGAFHCGHKRQRHALQRQRNTFVYVIVGICTRKQ